MCEDGRAAGRRVPVVEFIGLPGAGKSTIASSLVGELKGLGIEVRTTDDFVAWLTRQSRFKKLGMLCRDLPSACSQLWRALQFGLSLHPATGSSIARIALVPFINQCFDRYLYSNPAAVVIMDQANMQLVWSVGAYSSRYDEQSLLALSKVSRGRAARIFAYVSASAAVSAERIRLRASAASRFDRESTAGLNGALHGAAQLMAGIAGGLVQDGECVITLDATLPAEVNARRLFLAIRDELPGLSA